LPGLSLDNNLREKSLNLGGTGNFVNSSDAHSQYQPKIIKIFFEGFVVFTNIIQQVVVF
jgi:hypothetical protein